MKIGEMTVGEILYELNAGGVNMYIRTEQDVHAVFAADDDNSIKEFLEDLGAWHTPGQLARLGASLLSIGAMLTDESKQCVMGGGSYDDRGVRFEWVDGIPAGKSWSVHTPSVKAKYPQPENPELYKPYTRSGYVKISLPK